MKKLIVALALTIGFSSNAMAAAYWFNGSELDDYIHNLSFESIKIAVSEDFAGAELEEGDFIVYTNDNEGTTLYVATEDNVEAIETAEIKVDGYLEDEAGHERIYRLLNELDYLNDTGVPFGTRWQDIVRIADDEGWGSILVAYIDTMEIKNPHHPESMYNTVHEFLAKNVDHFLDPALEEEISLAVKKSVEEIDFNTAFATTQEAYTQGFNDGWRAAEDHHGITNN